MSHALSRNSDPDTSREAGLSIDVTRLEGIILDKLRRYAAPGATAYELAEALGMSLVSVSPRMRPLVEKRRIVDTGFRVRGAAGRNQIIWRAVGV